jgi:hypothetical protein
MKNQKKINQLKTGVKVYLKGEKVTNVTSPYDSKLVYQQPLKT